MGSEPERIEIYRPVAGVFVLAATGVGTGQYTIILYSIDDDGNVIQEVQDSGTANPGLIYALNIAIPSSGDLNNDGNIDCADLALVKAAFGKKAGQNGFDTRADVNLDNIIDVRDLAYVSKKLLAGTKCP